MPSTDIDGSVIVILTEDEAHRVYEYLSDQLSFDSLEQNLAKKIGRDLKLPKLANASCDSIVFRRDLVAESGTPNGNNDL